MRYPAVQEIEVDETTEKNHFDAIKKELQKEQPRRDVLLPLMKFLFPSRRNFILHSAISVENILLKFPALKLLYVGKTFFVHVHVHACMPKYIYCDDIVIVCMLLK